VELASLNRWLLRRNLNVDREFDFSNVQKECIQKSRDGAAKRSESHGGMMGQRSGEQGGRSVAEHKGVYTLRSSVRYGGVWL